MPTSSQFTYFSPEEVPPSSSLVHTHLKYSVHTPGFCFALIRPNPSVHDSLHHADRLIRHWVGGVSLRICAQHCPAGLLLEWLFTALLGMGLSIPSHPHRHNVKKKNIWGRPGAPAAQIFTTTDVSRSNHPAVAWQKWDEEARALHLACRHILIWKVIPGRPFLWGIVCFLIWMWLTETVSVCFPALLHI